MPIPLSAQLQQALQPLLEEPPAPSLQLSWDPDSRLWRSEFGPLNDLTPELREVFERYGYGCLAVKSNIGVLHLCHAADRDIEGFRGKPARARWQLVEMPTAPLVRLELIIFDNPIHPFRFESFLNVGDEEQLNVLAALAGQEELHLVFFGDDLEYRFTKTLPHDEQQWQQLDEITAAPWPTGSSCRRNSATSTGPRRCICSFCCIPERAYQTRPTPSLQVSGNVTQPCWTAAEMICGYGLRTTKL